MQINFSIKITANDKAASSPRFSKNNYVAESSLSGEGQYMCLPLEVEDPDAELLQSGAREVIIVKCFYPSQEEYKVFIAALSLANAFVTETPYNSMFMFILHNLGLLRQQ